MDAMALPATLFDAMKDGSQLRLMDATVTIYEHRSTALASR